MYVAVAEAETEVEPNAVANKELEKSFFFFYLPDTLEGCSYINEAHQGGLGEFLGYEGGFCKCVVDSLGLQPAGYLPYLIKLNV